MELKEYMERYLEILETRKKCYKHSRDTKLRGIEDMTRKALEREGVSYGYGTAQYSLDVIVNDVRLEVLNEVIRDLSDFLKEIEEV